MRGSNGPTVRSIAAGIGLMAAGAWFLFAGGTAVVVRGQLASQYPLAGHTVAAVASFVALVGLVSIVVGYRVGTSGRGRSPRPR